MASLSARGGWLIYHPSTVDCIGSLGGDQGWAQRWGGAGEFRDALRHLPNRAQLVKLLNQVNVGTYG